MDASIMNGSDGAAGSVVNVRQIRHPIRAANCILKQGWPVMLNSEAADEFAIQKGVEKSNLWLITELRKNSGAVGRNKTLALAQPMKTIQFSITIWKAWERSEQLHSIRTETWQQQRQPVV